MSVDGGWMTRKEAAEYASCSVRTINRANKADELQSIGEGHHWRTRAEWIDQWLIGDEDESKRVAG